MKHIKGERWRLEDGREVIVAWDLANEFVRVLNEDGKLDVIHENYFKTKLN
jgi:hypothetical protein